MAYKPQHLTGRVLALPYAYARLNGSPCDDALGELVRQLAPSVGATQIEAGTLRTWHPIPGPALAALRLRPLANPAAPPDLSLFHVIAS